MLTRSSSLDPISCLASLLSNVDHLCPCPVANSQLQAPFPTLFSRPLPLPVTVRIQVQNPLSGFAPKQTKESSAWQATYIVLHFKSHICLVSWGWRIHRLHLCRGVRPPPMSVLDITLNNLMVRFQWSWGFGECRTPLHCHCTQVYSGLER